MRGLPTKLAAGFIALASLAGFVGTTSAQTSSPTQCVASATAGGTSDAITIPLLPCGSTTNLLTLAITSSNLTTTSTLQQFGQPALPIVKAAGTALAIGDLPAGYRALLTQNGAQWILLNPATSSINGITLGTGVSAALAQPVTGTGSVVLQSSPTIQGVLNSSNAVVGSMTNFFNGAYSGLGSGTGVGYVAKFNREQLGEVSLNGTAYPQSPASWLETYLPNSVSLAQSASTSTIGGTAYFGGARASDYYTATGLHSGGAGGGYFIGVADDPVGSDIASGVVGWGIAPPVAGVNGITLGAQLLVSNGGTVTQISPNTGVTSSMTIALLLTSGHGTTGNYQNNITAGLVFGPSGTAARFERGIEDAGGLLDPTQGNGNLPSAITGAVSGSGGHCQITVTSTANFTTNDTASVSGIVGATACNTTSTTITVVDLTHVLLNGTTFGSAYVSGGSFQDTNFGGIFIDTTRGDEWRWVNPGNGIDSEIYANASGLNVLSSITATASSTGITANQVVNQNAGVAAGAQFGAYSNAGSILLTAYSVASGFGANLADNLNGTFYIDSKGSSGDFSFRTGAAPTEALHLFANGTIKTGAGGFTANASTAVSLTNIAPASAHATVQEWFTVIDSAGNARYIPAF